MSNTKSVFSSINKEADKLTEVMQRPTSMEDIQSTFGISIYKFFEVLHNLFGLLGLLTDSVEQDETKFRFIAAYPDETYEDTNVVTYDILRRTPLKIDSKVIQGSTTYKKPRFVKESFNQITGNVEELYNVAYNNVVSLTVFSNKARTLNEIARVIESIFCRYSSHLKKHVFEILPIGTNSIQFTDRYDQKDRIFSRELQFNVVTLEYFILEMEQLKSIDLLNINS